MHNITSFKIKPSTAKGKKYTAFFYNAEGKQVKRQHFGASGYLDFTIHQDTERKKNYIARHTKGQDWSDFTTAGSLSRYILWNEPTIEASIANYAQKFNLEITEGGLGRLGEYTLSETPPSAPKVSNKPNGEGASNFKDKVANYIANTHKPTRLQIEKIAREENIDKLEAKETTELVLVEMARDIVAKGSDESEIYNNLVALYNKQPNLSLRTSTSTLMQQYSTPAPLAYIASRFVKSNKADAKYFEPSAGNGLLTIAWPPEHTVVNEKSDRRLKNLKQQPFAKVFDVDASKEFDLSKYGSFFSNTQFDGIATNPPFGATIPITIGRYKITKLEHVMAVIALDQMKQSGKAAIIIGGHTEWDAKGRIKAGANRIFYSWLYSAYNVIDIINVNGKKLYTKMGTGFHVRLILIDGKANTLKYPPLKDALPTYQTETVNTWAELWERSKRYFDEALDADADEERLIAEAEAEALILILKLQK